MIFVFLISCYNIGLLILEQHPKELELGEFYLRYGLLPRKEKKRADKKEESIGYVRL